MIERCLGWLKEARAVATRYEKLALHYLASIHIAMIRRYLRALANRAYLLGLTANDAIRSRIIDSKLVDIALYDADYRKGQESRQQRERLSNKQKKYAEMGALGYDTPG
ncbi:hypothetical protein GCM10011289_04060 [Paludibacterium paludis]|uniref:Uncharacterized protein n=1 Tax=Paludibacterium paludis TaxID=1225769 RepID=A0A918NXE6_9NEIS|nr:hypothetical protein GCM10011289_04060 [Paludibacterium paludis]